METIKKAIKLLDQGRIREARKLLTEYNDHLAEFAALLDEWGQKCAKPRVY